MRIIPYNITIISNDYCVNDETAKAADTYPIYDSVRLWIQTDDLMLYLWCCHHNKCF